MKKQLQPRFLIPIKNGLFPVDDHPSPSVFAPLAPDTHLIHAGCTKSRPPRSLRGREGVHRLGHPHVSLREPIAVMRAERDFNSVVHVEPFRMVVHLEQSRSVLEQEIRREPSRIYRRAVREPSSWLVEGSPFQRQGQLVT